MGWTNPPSNMAKTVTGDVSEAIRRTSLTILRTLTTISPVDSGRFKGNWQVGISQKVKGVKSSEDKSGGTTFNEGAAVISAQKGFQDIWISNNLPYGERLNNGWSTQAPAGFVEMSVAKAAK